MRIPRLVLRLIRRPTQRRSLRLTPLLRLPAIHLRRLQHIRVRILRLRLPKLQPKCPLQRLLLILAKTVATRATRVMAASATNMPMVATSTRVPVLKGTGAAVENRDARSRSLVTSAL